MSLFLYSHSETNKILSDNRRNELGVDNMSLHGNLEIEGYPLWVIELIRQIAYGIDWLLFREFFRFGHTANTHCVPSARWYWIETPQTISMMLNKVLIHQLIWSLVLKLHPIKCYKYVYESCITCPSYTVVDSFLEQSQ